MSFLTEGSKRQVLEQKLESDYETPVEPLDEVVSRGDIAVIQSSGQVSEKKPFVVTVDDSPEQWTDYQRLLVDTGIIHARFHHPQAKRFGKRRWTKPEILLEEDATHSAAVELYRTIRLATESRDKLTSMDSSHLFHMFSSAEHRGLALNHLEVQEKFEEFVGQR